LLLTFGLVITLFFGWLFDDYLTPLALLVYVLILGFGWDILYQFLQSFRWDRDWPPLFQFLAGMVEGAFVWLLVQLLTDLSLFGQSGLPGVGSDLTFLQFLAHYGTVWLITFLITQSFMRIFFPDWRFRGGQWF
jgi:hypothetical protein